MSAVNILIHYVWVTKYRTPFLIPEVREDIFKHINLNADEKSINLLNINGYTDHIHCLIKLKPNQTPEQIARLLKGESSFWINKNKIIEDNFQWQREYYAESVSKKDLKKINGYINNQLLHHESASTNPKRELHLFESRS
jgi:putative transposase